MQLRWRCGEVDQILFGESHVPSGLFTVDPEQDLKQVQLNELIADLLTLDAFVTASIIGKGSSASGIGDGLESVACGFGSTSFQPAQWPAF